MHKKTFGLLLVPAILAFLASPLAAQPAVERPPSATAAVQRACDAAGGLRAYQAIGVLYVQVKTEEVTQDGHTSGGESRLFFATPGPVPGRMEMPKGGVVAGDDGGGGWAVVEGHVDARPATEVMVKRLLTSNLFPILLPFSLTWEGVTVTEVKPAELRGQPVWRLTVQLARSFFHTPQIGTVWTVDLHRSSFVVLQADSPFTDLGKGIQADGMRFSWRVPVKIGGAWLPSEQRVVGLDELGREKTHNRIDHIAYQVLPATEASKLFPNPVPPEKRPKLPLGPPPGVAPTPSGR